MGGDDQAPVTILLAQLEAGDRDAAARLLPLVYEELRGLAKARMAGVPAGQTLQATALVHEAYLRLVGAEDPGWNGRRHFFGAAARAMREILIEQARRKSAVKHGGGRRREPLTPVTPILRIESPREDILALDEALEKLERTDPFKAEIVMLRYFIGMSREETADALGTTTRTIDRHWRFVVPWLHRELRPGDPGDGDGNAPS